MAEINQLFAVIKTTKVLCQPPDSSALWLAYFPAVPEPT